MLMSVVPISMNPLDGLKSCPVTPQGFQQAPFMSSNEIPAMPDPDSHRQQAKKAPKTKGKTDGHVRQTPDLNPTTDSGPTKPGRKTIRLEPLIEKEVEELPLPPSESIPLENYPTSLRPEPTENDEDEQEPAPAPKSEPITSEAMWNQNLIDTGENKSILSKLIIPCTIALALCIVAMVLWTLSKKPSSDNTNRDQSNTATTNILRTQAPDWEPEARTTLSNYLEAEAQGDFKQGLQWLTDTDETKALLPRYQSAYSPIDEVQASAFVAKPLPASFTDRGIYLMYYQKPNTPDTDSLFRPLIPVRVKLGIDSASFLELSATSKFYQARNQQNICAFFKRGKDKRVTLDWPVFVQTRHRLLAQFTNRPQADAQQVFRLMIYQVRPSLVENVYRQHFPNHDWYRIHCPGYDHESHIVAIERNTPSSKLIKYQFGKNNTSGPQVHALTARLGWQASAKDGRLMLCISKIICLEFFNLNNN